MQITIDQATTLAAAILNKNGMCAEHANLVSEHLIDSLLSGDSFAGLSRVLAIVEHLRNRPPPQSIRVAHEDDRSALIDGGDNIGYVVSIVAMDKAIAICKKSGVALVGANNTWFSGRLAHYVERAAAQGFVAIHTTNTTARVAPYGGIDRIFGTNPFAMAFPCDDEPLIIDFGTSMTTWGDVLLRQKLGQQLDNGCAVDPNGWPTNDPTSALQGALLPWGEHRGYGLSLICQILGILAGSAPIIDDVSNYGFFFLVFDPTLLMPLSEFKQSIAELKRRIKTSRPQSGRPPVRVPGEASQQLRRLARARGTIEVDERLYEALIALTPLAADERQNAIDTALFGSAIP
jgi:LDH2 family malate/lactate/ureidoglycolate dehydrogenase